MQLAFITPEENRDAVTAPQGFVRVLHAGERTMQHAGAMDFREQFPKMQKALSAEPPTLVVSRPYGLQVTPVPRR
jgi:hypothetical protein